MVSRRAFLKAGGLAMFGIGLGGVPSFVTRAADAVKTDRLYKKKKIIVCIFQRGAMDGLMAVTPYTDQHLQAWRPDLLLNPVKEKKAESLIVLDDRFGLHPSAVAFEQLFKDKRLAIVHGMGSPNNTRSHFDAQDYMESGTPFDKSTTSGWLNRVAGELGHDASAFQAVSLTAAMPRSLYGDSPALAISQLKNFSIRGSEKMSSGMFAANSFEELYDETSSGLLKETGKESFEAIKILREASKNVKANPDAGYPASSLGNSLNQIAQLIKMDVGLEVAFAESQGWDTHLNQGKDKGVFARNIFDLSKSITAFWSDIEAYQDEVLVITMTEFGRTVKQNGTRGTDHGRASCAFLLGNHVNGGIVHGSIPELAHENLEDQRDLPVTTDFRSVFADITKFHLGLRDNQVVFPDWSGKMAGVMKQF